MALLTAYRQLIPPKENKRRNKQLLGKMNARGMGPYVLIGHWQECQDNAIPYEDCPEDMMLDAVEEAFMIIKPDAMSRADFHAFILAAVIKYNQNCALVKQDGFYYIYDQKGVFSKVGSSRKFGLSQAYSQHIKKMDIPFVFEGVLVPATIGGKYIARQNGLLHPHMDGLLQGDTLIQRIDKLLK